MKLKSQFILSLSLAVIIILSSENLYSQDTGSGYTFTMVKQVKATPVKDQELTNTCWSFATTSFLESELLRIGQPQYDLSEMFFVRNAYADKANLYVRYQGTNNFGEGGQAHDVLNIVRKYGMVTEELYPGKNYGTKEHIHNELHAMLKSIVDVVIKNLNGKISTAWFTAYESVLDSYFGKLPEEFTINNRKLTPKGFTESIGLNPDSYVEITSFNHQPFNKYITLEVPDNWSRDKYFNLPLDEMMTIIDNALSNGFSVCWDGDNSNKGFADKRGIAIIPVLNMENAVPSDKFKWTGLSESDRNYRMYAFDGPVPELLVTQEKRQLNFDNQTMVDDHLMHIVGIANDQNGTKYYYTKNSWGTENLSFNGYFYMSEQYLRMNTIAIMVHKDAIPVDIATRMGLIKYR